jgi:hypothetical protein
MGRKYRSDCTAHQDHTEAYGYPFQTRSPSDNDLFDDYDLIPSNVRLMLSGDIPPYNSRQVDWLKPFGSLYHFGIPAQSPDCSDGKNCPHARRERQHKCYDRQGAPSSSDFKQDRSP